MLHLNEITHPSLKSGMNFLIPPGGRDCSPKPTLVLAVFLSPPSRPAEGWWQDLASRVPPMMQGPPVPRNLRHRIGHGLSH